MSKANTVWSAVVTYWLAPLLGIAYGVFLHYALSGNTLVEVGVLSLTFLCGVPLVIGALTVAFAPSPRRGSVGYAIGMPWLTTGLFLLFAGLVRLDVLICLIMAAPILGIMGVVGGVTAFVIMQLLGGPDNDRGRMSAMALFAAAPLLFAPIERLLPEAHLVRTVSTALVIRADPEPMWDALTTFERVQPQERRFSWYHLAGLPRPIEAALGEQGLGGVRHSQWEHGLAFNGTIIDWVPNRRFTVQLEAITDEVFGTRLPLRGIGGRYFDVVDDSYIIEPLGPGLVRLQLDTTYRLTTRFNPYGALWIDFFLTDIQRDLLEIVRGRFEGEP